MLKRIIPCLFASLLMLAGETAYAFRNHHTVPPRGTVVGRLPRGHSTVRVGRSRYFYNGGAFYRRGPSGFMVVGPPAGAVVLTVPLGSRAVIMGGITHYVYGDVFYRRIHTRYLVVEPPPATVVIKEVSPVVPSEQRGGEQVSVTAPLLNVRSGPGTDFPVTREVHQGDLLTVHGYAPEWLYVKLSTGEFGWVMLKYTSPISPSANG